MSEKIVTIAGTDFEVALKPNAKSFTTAEGKSVEIVSISEGEAIVLVDGRRSVVPFHVVGDEVHLMLDGEVYRATVADKLARKRARHGGHSLSAPMPGVVLKIFVEVGQEVARGTPLLILEAMKMEHPIASPYDGIVESISCTAGELVQPGIDLIAVAPKEEG